MPSLIPTSNQRKMFPLTGKLVGCHRRGGDAGWHLDDAGLLLLDAAADRGALASRGAVALLPVMLRAK